MQWYSNIGFSFFFHSLVVLGIFIFSQDFKSPKEITKPIFVEFYEKQTKPETSSGHKLKIAMAKKNRISLSKLGIANPYPTGKKGTLQNFQGGQNSASWGNKFLDYSSEGVAFFNQSYLYDLIEDKLRYPPVFKRYGVYGNVSAQIAFNLDGTWNKKRSQIKGNSNYLIGLVRQVIRDALKNPLPSKVIQTLAKYDSVYFAHCLFQFDISQGLSTIKMIFRNAKKEIEYVFYRSIKKKGRWGTWELGPLSGGDQGVGLDVLGLFDLLSKSKQERRTRDLRPWLDTGRW